MLVKHLVGTPLGKPVHRTTISGFRIPNSHMQYGRTKDRGSGPLESEQAGKVPGVGHSMPEGRGGIGAGRDRGDVPEMHFGNIRKRIRTPDPAKEKARRGFLRAWIERGNLSA